MSDLQHQIEYSARTAYEDIAIADCYEEDRFSGLMGRYRWRREQAGVGDIVRSLPRVETILDCPCGVGRWWSLLSERADAILAMDISPQMLDRAAERVGAIPVSVELRQGDAEALPLADGSVDFVFSHALGKHLPLPVQHVVLKEFARVARVGVIYSVGVFTHLTYEIWRRRRLVESYPVLPEQLEWLAREAGLEIVRSRKCTTPIGVEQTVLLRHR